MKRKNIKKDTMIQQVKESLKIYKQKIIQCKDQNEYQQLKLNVDNLQQSLSILQKNTFIEKYESKEIIDQEKLRQIEQQKQKKKLQLEKKRLQEQKKRLQEKKLQDERIQKERKKMQEINKNKKEIKRKLQIIFQQYGKHSIKKKDTFQNKSDKQIDLKGFLNYIRQFQILTDNFSVYDVVNYFKKQSQNGLCLKYEQFEQLIFKIASIRYKKINNMESTEDINLQFLNQHATNSQRMKKYFNVKQTKQKKHQFKFYVHSGKMKQDIIEQIRIRRENAKLKKKNLRNKSLTKTEIKNKQIVTPSHKKITLSHEFQKKHHSQSLLSYKKIFKSIEQLKDIQPEPDILKKIGYFDQQQLIQPDYDKKNYIIQLIKQKKKSIVLPPIKLK